MIRLAWVFVYIVLDGDLLLGSYLPDTSRLACGLLTCRRIIRIIVAFIITLLTGRSSTVMSALIENKTMYLSCFY